MPRWWDWLGSWAFRLYLLLKKLFQEWPRVALEGAASAFLKDIAFVMFEVLYYINLPWIKYINISIFVSVFANFTVCFAAMQDHCAPRTRISWEWLQQEWAKTNNIFGNAQVKLLSLVCSLYMILNWKMIVFGRVNEPWILCWGTKGW
jgi:hypothetical protein